MSVKILKVVYALTHLIIIKEVMNPSEYIIAILLVYAILTFIVNAIHIKEENEQSMKYIK